MRRSIVSSLLALSALAAGAPAHAAKPTITLISPKAGSIVHASTFTVVVDVKDPGASHVNVTLNDNRPVGGKPGRFRLTFRSGDGPPGIEIQVEAQNGEAFKRYPITIEPPITAVQSPDIRGRNQLLAPGCRICVINDPRGDDHGGPPDIKSLKSVYAGGWITITIVTYDPVSSGHGGHPCVAGYVDRSGFSAGCFEGPHTGMIFGGDVGGGTPCAHPDANHDCGSAHMSFPNSHTTVYRFRSWQIGNPASFYWDAWVLYPGDAFKDTAPSAGPEGGPGTHVLYCVVRQQLRPEPARSYSFGRNPCSQKLVVTAK